MCILLYVKLIQCSRALQLSVRLAGGGSPSAFYELTLVLYHRRFFLRKTNKTSLDAMDTHILITCILCEKRMLCILSPHWLR